VLEHWIRAVMGVESGIEPRTRSKKGAMDTCDRHDNIPAGAAYICELYDRYGAPGFLAA
jgi:hypothetical protein